MVASRENRGRRENRALPAVAGGLALAVLCAAGLPGGGAQAHAIIESVTPPLGQLVGGPDVDFSLRFNSRLDHQRSRLTIMVPGTAPGGGAWPLPIMLPATDPATLTARAKGLVPGVYILHWQVLAVDGHMTRGDIPFTVGPSRSALHGRPFTVGR